MTRGPLEYVAIGVPTDHNLGRIVQTLSAIEETGALRVVDFLLLRTDAAGAVTVQEVSADGLDAVASDSDGAGEAPVPGLLSMEDAQTMARELPINATAVVVLLEHTWASTLTEVIRGMGGVLYTGGLIPPEALAQVAAGDAALQAAATP